MAKKRKKISFDPTDESIRKALDLVGEELDISPGQVINTGTLMALIQLLEKNPDMMNRQIFIRNLRFNRGLANDDLVSRLKKLLDDS